MNIDILHRPTSPRKFIGGPDEKPWRAGFGPRAVGCPCMIKNMGLF